VGANNFSQRLLARAAAVDVAIPPEILPRLETYFDLLRQWNGTVNLTALALMNPPAETLDRLFIEPLAAASHLETSANAGWFDLGSGGGSPAIPVALARPDLRLTMVEARARKAAFLREAVRATGIVATVEGHRFEAVASQRPGSAELVTARGVRIDDALFSAAAGLLKVGGDLVLLVSAETPIAIPSVFELKPEVPLLQGRTSMLRARRVFHVEQRG
jgi:16S rRNA (guanine527-N7)-methyltransferase